MNSKQTLLGGIVALVVGLVLWAFLKDAVATVFSGALTLLVLVVGILLVALGYYQVKEDRENAKKEQEEQARTEAMASSS